MQAVGRIHFRWLSHWGSWLRTGCQLEALLRSKRYPQLLATWAHLSWSFTSHLLLFNPCIIPSWLWAEPSYLFLINRKKSDGMPIPRWDCKRLWLLSRLQSLFLSLVHFDEASAVLCDALWRDPHGKEPRRAYSQQLLRNWGPQCKKLNPANNRRSELESRTFPVKPWEDFSHVRVPEPEDPVKPLLDSWPR